MNEPQPLLLKWEQDFSWLDGYDADKGEASERIGKERGQRQRIGEE